MNLKYGRVQGSISTSGFIGGMFNPLLTLNIFLEKSKCVQYCHWVMSLLSSKVGTLKSDDENTGSYFACVDCSHFNPGSVLSSKIGCTSQSQESFKILVLHARLIRSESLGVELCVSSVFNFAK